MRDLHDQEQRRVDAAAAPVLSAMSLTESVRLSSRGAARASAPQSPVKGADWQAATAAGGALDKKKRRKKGKQVCARMEQVD